MADTEYEEKLDFLDKLSVILYRSGISLFSATALAYAFLVLGKSDSFTIPADWEKFTILSFCISTAMAAANIHVYSKVVRIVISWSGLIGILIYAAVPSAPFSGIALKESFCFRVTGLKLLPMLLAFSVFSIVYEFAIIAAGLLLISGLISAYLSLCKWKMPLHFDIGMKSKYQI